MPPKIYNSQPPLQPDVTVTRSSQQEMRENDVRVTGHALKKIGI
jgi:hypothetical protein